MDKAKESVKKFMSKSGHHDTTIHENVAPAVQHEEVQRHQHEETQAAIDREVHQDHYHTTEQPVLHSETLPEQHHHNLIPVEHKSYEHDDAEQVKARLADEQSKYRDEQRFVEGEHTHATADTIAGEHVHHHVHENIQPVVQKQTIEPHVVHTTVPIHEVHHNAAQHHSSSALDPVSMDDFKARGGTLGGREERHDHFEGEPRAFGGHLRDSGNTGTQATSGYSGETSGTGDRSYVGGASGASGMGDRSGYSGNEGYSGDTSKPGLMDKLNPNVDATGDGKAGFMK